MHAAVHAVVLLVLLDHVPGSHGIQLVPRPWRFDQVPAGQSLHVDALVAPITVENVPMGHNVHCVEPGADQVPAGQATSTPRAA